MTKHGNGSMVSKAFDIAEAAHEGQIRNGIGKPYLGHPCRVALYVAELEGAADIHIAAALLHDVVEDCLPEFSTMMSDQLPPEVWDLVFELTNVNWNAYKVMEEDKIPRVTRKKWDRERLGRCTSWAQTIKLADRLDNVRTLGELNQGFRGIYSAETVLLIDALEDSPRNNPIKREIMKQIEDYLK